MRRSQLSAFCSPTYQSDQRRSIFSTHANGSDTDTTEAAIAMGRLILERPRAGQSMFNYEINTFSASSAGPPPRRNSELSLKSCLSSCSMSTMTRSKSSINEFGNYKTKFQMERNVSFSHVAIREYEITLGDNPSVSSGAPISLGWNYDPNEKISNLPDLFEGSINTRKRRSARKLSDRERRRRLRSNPNVSETDLIRTLNAIDTVKQQRRQSLDEIHEESAKQVTMKNRMELLKELSFSFA
ncbi:hypothetical protein ACHAW6_001049 [Cyclotella cf. meneghiniana]